ncbi:M20/M25/M40 family metallo-hydrolase [Paenibacillus agilis]|uniref:M20/M25/M40 family metallo-hydrolase n=1 Tax=Paenibacillus agilis TaxID=3020863 RepID=A0A559J1Q1_9BACL|nr:M20/M25/M40 family metallo-hydrolase [Paenibacillus agilis]TVX93815.1 M20/M25/M40 family metallo-hydrolase [Paenibacillus agilis]
MERVIKKEPKRGLTGIKAVSIAFVILVLIAATLFVDQPPRPQPSTAPTEQFSAERAMQHLQFIAKETRPSGSERIKHVRDYVVAELTKLGIQPQVQQEQGTTYDNKSIELHNIVGVLKGKNSEGKALMLSTHYDSVYFGPGANDAGVSVAALIETVRALKNGEPLQNDIWIVITDGEEIGLLGAKAFWDKAEHREKIGLVANFEARGSKGASLMFQTSEENGALIQHFAQGAPEPVANSFMGDLYRLLPNDTDLTVALHAGIPGLNFAYIAGWSAYHTPKDNLENVDLSTLQHQGENALAMSRQFGNAELEQLRSPDHVYFSLFGQLAHYPKSIVAPITIVLWLTAVALIVVAFRQQQIRLRGMMISVLAVIGSAVLSLSVNYLLYQLVYTLWAKKMTLFNGATYDAYLYHISFLLITLFVHALLMKKWNARTNVLEIMLVGMVLFLLILTVSVIWLPGASYLWMVPLIIHSIVIGFSLYKKDADRVLNGVPAILLTAFAPIVLFTTLFHLLFHAMSPSITLVVSIIFTFILALLNPAFRLLSAHHRWFVAVLSVCLVVLLAWGWMNAVPSEDRPVYEHLLDDH